MWSGDVGSERTVVERGMEMQTERWQVLENKA